MTKKETINKIKENLELRNKELEGLKFPKMTDPNKDRDAFHDELFGLVDDKNLGKQIKDYMDDMFYRGILSRYDRQHKDAYHTTHTK